MLKPTQEAENKKEKGEKKKQSYRRKRRRIQRINTSSGVDYVFQN